MQKYSATGISFPNEVLLKIDTERGDISRSRYILRQLEKVPQAGPILPKTNQPTGPNGSESNG
jgi:hypothetical protein